MDLIKTFATDGQGKVPFENAYGEHFIAVLEILDYTLPPIVRQHTPDNLAGLILEATYMTLNYYILHHHSFQKCII